MSTLGSGNQLNRTVQASDTIRCAFRVYDIVQSGRSRGIIILDVVSVETDHVFEVRRQSFGAFTRAASYIDGCIKWGG